VGLFAVGGAARLLWLDHGSAAGQGGVSVSQKLIFRGLTPPEIY